MRKYDEYLAEQAGATFLPSTWAKVWEHDPSTTIEHIFPQTYPKKDDKLEKFKKNWRHGRGNRYNSQKRLDLFVHNIGNLTILEPGLNIKAEQKSYEEKIAMYGHLMRIHPDLNSSYLQNGYWTEESVKAREKDILEFIKDTWNT